MTTRNALIAALRSRVAVASFIALAGAVMPAQAHSGHTITESTPWHVVTSPYHVITLAGIGAALILGSLIVHQRVPRRAMQALGTTAMAVTALLWALNP